MRPWDCQPCSKGLGGADITPSSCPKRLQGLQQRNRLQQLFCEKRHTEGLDGGLSEDRMGMDMSARLAGWVGQAETQATPQALKTETQGGQTS